MHKELNLFSNTHQPPFIITAVQLLLPTHLFNQQRVNKLILYLVILLHQDLGQPQVCLLDVPKPQYAHCSLCPSFPSPLFGMISKSSVTFCNKKNACSIKVLSKDCFALQHSDELPHFHFPSPSPSCYGQTMPVKCWNSKHKKFSEHWACKPKLH